MGEPVVPIQMCKLPTPRICTTDETRETLAIWFDTSANFFSGDDRFKRFLTPTQTWDRNHAAGHYGFQQEPQASRLRRAPAEIEADLLRFFSAVSGFFPFTFLTRTFPETTSWVTMKTMVYKTYNMELNGVSFLTFNQIKRCPEENYYIFYERLLDHFRQHLVGPNVQALGFNSGDGGDGFNLSTLNMVAMFWLERLDKRLLQVVKKEYATQLMAGTQLVTLVPRIANDMDTLMAKVPDLAVNRFQSGSNRDNGRNFSRYTDDGPRYGSGSRGNNRGRDRNDRGRDRGDRRVAGPKYSRALPNTQDSSRRSSQFQCSHCKQLEREMRMRVPSDHNPLECQRRKIQVCLFQGDEYEQDYHDADQEEIQEDFDDFDQEGPFQQHYDQSSYTLSLQSSESRCRCQQLAARVEPSSNDCILSHPDNHDSIFSLLMTVSISDLSSSFFERVNKVLLGICTISPTKSRAPRLLGDYLGRMFLSIVDSGADLNCLDYNFVREMSIPFQPTDAGVTAAGGSKVCLAGVTTHDFIFYIVVRGQSVPVNAQRAVVVHNLGADSILGEPGKSFNDLETNARRRQISIRYEGQKLVFPYHEIDRDHYGIARVRDSETVYPGQSCTVPVPETLSGEEILLYTPRRGNSNKDDFAAGFYPNCGGFLRLINTSETATKVSCAKPIGDLRSCTYSQVRGKKTGKAGAAASGVADQITGAKVSFPLLVGDDYDPDSDEIEGFDKVENPSEIGHSDKNQEQDAYDWDHRDQWRSEYGSQHDYGARHRGNSSGVRSLQGAQGAGQSSRSEEGYSGLSHYSGQTRKKSFVGGVAVSPSSDFRYQDFKEPQPAQAWQEPEIQLDPDGVMPGAAKAEMRSITNKFAQVFTKAPGKYNGYFGKVDNSIVFASKPTPNTKIYMPSYTEEMKKIQGDLMDTLMSYGVLVKPEDIGVTPEVVCPSLLVPKSDPGEFRLVTDFSKLNKHIRKYPSTSPTIAEAKSVLAEKRFFVHLDLSNYFFQSGLDKGDSKYLATYHPFRGLLVYVVEPQGLKNASEHGYEVLGRVYGDMCARGKMTRIADSLFPVGDTHEELAANYEETLRRADLSGLTFKPGKVIICPLKTVLFGWELNGTEWRPTSQTTSTLVAAERPSTVKGLRSFLGAYKQFSDCVDGYAMVLHDLESIVGGRASVERINWTDHLKEVFESAKKAAGDITGVHVPRSTDTLHIYSSYKADTRAVGGKLVIVREEDGIIRYLHGGYFSVILDKFKSSWTPCEAEAAGIRLTVQHFAQFIKESRNITKHFTDNMPSVQAWRRCLKGQFSASSRISTFLVNLSALSVELVYKPGKTLHSANRVSGQSQFCSETSSCQICGFAKKWQKLGDESDQLRTITVKDVLEGKTAMPLIQRKAWIGAQLNCPVHVQLKKLVQNGQHPDKKKTKGDHTLLKRLYNLYQAGDLVIQNDGLVMVKSRDGHFPGGMTISVPNHLMSGISFSLHVKLGHPSKGQLTSLMAKYFYCTGGINIIHSVVENCVQCRSVGQVPKEFMEDLTEQVEAFGTHFLVDVIEKNSQKILLVREKLSKYTWLELVADHTMASLKETIFQTLLPWIHSGGAVIRCSGAQILKAVAKDAVREGSVFKEYGISFDSGGALKPDMKMEGETATRECGVEIVRHKPGKALLTVEDLVIIAKRMNDRTQGRGTAAKEILTRRDLVLNAPKNVQDSDLQHDQFENRDDTEAIDGENNVVGDPVSPDGVEEQVVGVDDQEAAGGEAAPSIKPKKRTRGRPRKKPLPQQDNVPATTRYRRDAAVRASDRIKKDALATLQQQEATIERFYKPGAVPPDPDEEAFEVVMVPVDFSKYWFYPPPVNYQFMEEVDWEFPAWEDWVQDNPMELEDHHQEPPDQLEQRGEASQTDQIQAVRGLSLQLEVPLIPAAPEPPEPEEYREGQRVQEEVPVREEGRRLRRPQLPAQVNTMAAANLEDVLGIVNVSSESEQEPEQRRPRSSSRQSKLPGKYDDFEM